MDMIKIYTMLLGCIFLFSEVAVSFREALINFSGVAPLRRFLGRGVDLVGRRGVFFLMGLTGWSVDFWKKVDDEISLIRGIYIIYHGILFIRNRYVYL